MTPSDIRRRLITNAVSHLRELGYLGITSENILTDPLYAEFFKWMLKGEEYDSEIKRNVSNELINSLPK